MTDSTLKPFHESIVDTINKMTITDIGILGLLIKTTRIPDGHEEIARAWDRKTGLIAPHTAAFHEDVSESVMVQKVLA